MSEEKKCGLLLTRRNREELCVEGESIKIAGKEAGDSEIRSFLVAFSKEAVEPPREMEVNPELLQAVLDARMEAEGV